MIIQREFKAGDFHVANDRPFLDADLSWAARGVLGYLFSKSEDWTPRIYDIVKNGPCEKYKIKSVFEELEEHGYLHRRKIRDEEGKFDWQVKVFDHPRDDPGWTEFIPDSAHDGRDGGATNKDNNQDGQSPSNDERDAPAREGEQKPEPPSNTAAKENEGPSAAREVTEEDRTRDDDHEGVQIWIDVTGDPPPPKARDQLREWFVGDGSLTWNSAAFRDALEEAYYNVSGEVDRIQMGTLLSQYKRHLNYATDGAVRIPDEPESKAQQMHKNGWFIDGEGYLRSKTGKKVRNAGGYPIQTSPTAR